MAGGEGAIDVGFELVGEAIEGGGAVAGQEVEAVDVPALGFEVRSEFCKYFFGVPEAVDEDDGVAIGGHGVRENA